MLDIIAKNLEAFRLNPLAAVLDIETAGTAEDAIIYSIGVVIVNIQTLEIVDGDYIKLTHNQMGRTFDQDTQTWWEEQREKNPAAWREVFGVSGERRRLTDGLMSLSLFLESHLGDTRAPIFGNGPEFDNRIVDHAFNQAGIKTPWDFGCNQSMRTINWVNRILFGVDLKKAAGPLDMPHHALMDARHEATQLLIGLKNLYEAFGISHQQDIHHASC